MLTTILVVLAMSSCAIAEETSILPRTVFGEFKHKGTGRDLEDWKAWIQEAKKDISPYPANRFTGKGLVMTAGGRKYFTCAYLNIRVIRETIKSNISIEVFYAGNTEMSDVAIDYMEETFENVKFIDITKVKDSPPGLSFKGYQIKVFSILYSSFKEVLFLDADNIPLMDPSIVFELKQYKKTGALFWPDYCNMHSAVIETWDAFGLARPVAWADRFNPNKTTVWTPSCNSKEPFEIESGEIVVNKKKAWNGLIMTAFINAHHGFFQKRLMHGDKQTFSFGFNASETPYSIVRKHPFAVGIKKDLSGGNYFFCANTMGQRHPVTGDILFMHRNAAKYVGASSFLQFDPVPRLWTHFSKQNPRSSHNILYREEVPEGIMFPSPDVQVECTRPTGKEVVVRKLDDTLFALEDDLVQYLKDLANLPFYPGYPISCEGDRAFFCKYY